MVLSLPRNRVALLAAWMATALAAWGNIAFVQRDGQTLVPVSTTAVRMAAEKVVIRPGDNGWVVEAWFEMCNDSDVEVAGLIGFPVSGFRGRFGQQRAVDDSFKVETSSEAGDAGFVPVAVTLEIDDASLSLPVRDAIPRRGEYLENLVWEAHWAPGQTRWFTVRYGLGIPNPVQEAIGLVQAERLTYVVRTANLWNGPVGRATFRVLSRDGPYLRPDDRREGASVRSTFPLPAVGAALTWTFEKWAPTVDWEVDMAIWNGLPDEGEEHRYRMWLPHEYRGDQEPYDDALLERLVKRELEPAQHYFPDRVAGIDRSRLRRIVALWLHQEIFARRGEPFIVAPYVSDREDQLRPTSDITDHTYYYSWWSDGFSPYRHRNGFYQPNTDLGVKGVSWRKLNRWEKANVRLLRGVFAPGTEKARTGAIK